MKKALDLYSIRTELENGSISEFTDLSWKNPLVVELEEILHLPQNNQNNSNLIARCSDISGISAKIFFWDNAAALLSNPVLHSRLPFDIAICKGKLKIVEDGILRIDAYLAVMEKNVHVNANVLTQTDLCEMVTYIDNYIDEYQNKFLFTTGKFNS